MITKQTLEYVNIEDVCVHNKLDFNEVIISINESDISYGTNSDTFITGVRLENILGKELDFSPFTKDIMISLGS